MKYAVFAVALIAVCLGVGWLSYRIRFRGLLKDLEKHLSDERHSTHEGASMSREAFESFMRREYENMPLDRIGTGEYREWFVWRTWQAWQAARAAALDEAAEVCERIGPAMAERYGPGAECITTSDECADAIRALKEKE